MRHAPASRTSPRTDEHAVRYRRSKALLSFLPSNNLEEAPRVEPSDDPDRVCTSLDTFMPDSCERPLRRA
jgi:acetyl-CoA carboxylase carboxyltransferase component